MARALDHSRFSFEDNCREEDLDEIVRMFLDGTKAFPDWPYIVQDTPPEELFKWSRDTFFKPKLKRAFRALRSDRDCIFSSAAAEVGSSSCSEWSDVTSSMVADI